MQVVYNDRCEPELWVTWTPRLPDRVVVKIDMDELRRTQRRVRLNRLLEDRPTGPPSPDTGNPGWAETTGR